MHRGILLTALGIALTLATACGGATRTGASIAVSDARIPVPAGANGAVYLTLANDSGTADALVGADADVAAAVELHETSMSDGVMSMRPVPQIEVPAGGEAVLEPGGPHIMLIDVTGGLAAGDQVDVVLEFAGAGEQSVTATVVPIGGAGG